LLSRHIADLQRNHGDHSTNLPIHVTEPEPHPQGRQEEDLL
jgi:hypothetical protein